ncbi:hypothetical protein GCM10009817_27610 [Terrabacter lapilli]|uniref:Uncharacterized protein n=1 Tax=Terrabacter lapilli TaxID=436231 RepID=A0ABN2SDE9_9MICO
MKRCGAAVLTRIIRGFRRLPFHFQISNVLGVAAAFVMMVVSLIHGDVKSFGAASAWLFLVLALTALASLFFGGQSKG